MRSFLLVAVGGAVGATVRWTVGELLPGDAGGFPWATLAVNLVGCALIGIAARVLAPGSPAWTALAVGGLGGLTTFSTFAVETRALVEAGRAGQALAYVAVSTLAGVGVVEYARERGEP